MSRHERSGVSGISESNGSAQRLPSGPASPPIAQQLQWLFRPIPFLERARRRHGKIFRARLAGGETPVFVVGDPAVAKAVLAGPPDQFRGGETNKPFRPVVGDNSILLLDGDEHLRQRKLILPAFSGSHVRDFADQIARTTHERISSWETGKPFGIQREMEAISFETIMRVSFGELNEHHERLRALVPEMMDRCASPLLLMPWFRQDLGGITPAAKTRRVLREIDSVLFQLIAEGRADPLVQLRTDVLALLLNARHEDGSPMGDQLIRDELLTLLMAGYETTTSALSWTFERLLRTPQAHERLLGEMERGEDEYLNAVIKEGLRARTAVPVVARRVNVPVQLGGYTFPAGSVLMVSIYLVHRDPEMYPDPEVFRPERFLEEGSEARVWIPFGGGVRRCLGASFAQLEMKVVLQTILSRVALRAPDQADEAPQRRRFILAPENEARVVADSIEPHEPVPTVAPRFSRRDRETGVPTKT
jgi:cytochrome P450